MEVSGKKLSDQDRTYCKPCYEEGENNTADAFCTICKEYLCSTCIQEHRALKATKRHTLLGKTSMPTSMTDISNEDDSNVPCDIHPKEFIKYFCHAHETVNCGHCAVFQHRSCKISLISELSDSFKNGQDYSDIKCSIAKLLQDEIDCISDVESNTKMVLKLSEDEVKKLKEYREKVNNYFDEREKSLLQVIKQMKEMDKTRLDFLKPKCDNIKGKLNEMKCTLDEQERNSVNLFIEAKKVRKQVECLQAALNDISKENIVQRYEFIKDTATEKLIAGSSGLGVVSKDQTLAESSGLGKVSKDMTLTASIGFDTVSKDQTLAVNSGLGILGKEQTQRKQTVPIDLTSLKFTAAPGIPLNSQTDTKECLLSGMLLLPDDRLLVSDQKNSSVKLVDLQTSSMISQIELQCVPWGMCVLPRDRVAVCLYAKSSVVFLDTRGQLTVGTSIKVDGKCYDIVHHNAQLVVAFDGGKIVKMDMEGNIIKRVYGQALFRSCPNMTLIDDSQKPAILVSDNFNHTVIKLDIELNILQTIKDPKLQQPRGIIAVGKQLLLCSYGSHKIMRLDLSTGKMIQLLGESEGIQHPHSVVYSPEQNKLYITSYAYKKNDLGNNVYVYKAL